MQNYFGPFYFGELKPYSSKYCSKLSYFGPQLIFVSFNFAVLCGSWNSRNKGHANIKGFTIFWHYLFSSGFIWSWPWPLTFWPQSLASSSLSQNAPVLVKSCNMFTTHNVKTKVSDAHAHICLKTQYLHKTSQLKTKNKWEQYPESSLNRRK